MMQELNFMTALEGVSFWSVEFFAYETWRRLGEWTINQAKEQLVKLIFWKTTLENELKNQLINIKIKVNDSLCQHYSSENSHLVQTWLQPKTGSVPSGKKLWEIMKINEMDLYIKAVYLCESSVVEFPTEFVEENV